MAFITRLSSTCCNWIRSPRIRGTSAARCVSTRTPWPLHSAASQGERIADGGVEVKPILLGGRALGERANPVHDVGRAMAVGDHPQGGLPRFLQVLGGEPANAGT